MRTFKNTDEIRTERAANRNNPVIYSLLAVLLGELDRRPNQNTPITEGDIYKTIKKLYDAAIECGNAEEEKYLEEFIKKQLTEDELRDVIKGIVESSGINTIGGIMKCLNNYYSGQYDGRVASQLIKSILN